MNRTDLLIEGGAGSIAAILTAALMPRVSALLPSDTRTGGRLAHGVTGYVMFRTAMSLVRRSGQGLLR